MDLHVDLSERDHVRGPASAQVTLVEYGDFDCPYCAQAYPVVRALLERFAAELRFVFRHNPRGDLHPHARLAAQAAEAAALQGQFWPMHDRLFEHPGTFDEAALLGHAQALRLEQDKFASDLHAAGVRNRVRDDEVGGLRSGVIGTPTFFVNGYHLRDKPDFDTLAEALAGHLSARFEPG